MKKAILKNSMYWFSSVVLGIVLGFSLQLVSAWVAPTGTPPTGNVGAPINTGDSLQEKIGPLIITGFRNKSATVLDGIVGIGVPYMGTPPVAQISSGLKLDVEGKVGATEYCNADETVCRVATDLINGTGGAKGSYSISGDVCYPGDTAIGWKRIAVKCVGSEATYYSCPCDENGGNGYTQNCTGSTSCTTSFDSSWLTAKPTAFTCTYKNEIETGPFNGTPATGCGLTTKTCTSSYAVLCKAN